MTQGKDYMMPTKDELLFENQCLREDGEILLKRAQEADQAREQIQVESELLRAEIKEAQTEKEQAEALAEQLRERLSQSPQHEEVKFLKERLQKALSAVCRTQKTQEQRMARLELAREQDRREVKESFTWMVETIEDGHRAL
jgi:Rad3-related DNA helicase